MGVVAVAVAIVVIVVPLVVMVVVAVVEEEVAVATAVDQLVLDEIAATAGPDLWLVGLALLTHKAPFHTLQPALIKVLRTVTRT